MNVFDVLGKVYGVRGLPFPGNPQRGGGRGIGEQFSDSGSVYPSNGVAGGFGDAIVTGIGGETSAGTPVKKYTDERLGEYVFMPVYLDGIELPNAVIIITGEKRIIETDITEVGTVFEKVFIRPYDITILVTLIGKDGEWPQSDLSTIVNLWKKGDITTLQSAVTDNYLQAKGNFLITKNSHLDAQGAENVEVIQIEGRSNVDFELEIL